MRITLLSIGLTIATAVIALSINDQPAFAKADEKSKNQLISLADSISPLSERFNANNAQPQLVAILSPS